MLSIVAKNSWVWFRAHEAFPLWWGEYKCAALLGEVGCKSTLIVVVFHSSGHQLWIEVSNPQKLTHGWVPFVKTPPGVLWAGDSCLSRGNTDSGSDEAKSSWCEKLGFERWKWKRAQQFGSSLPGLENEIERGDTNNLCVKLSLLLEAPAVSIRQP